MRSIKQWFETLPEPIRSKALAEVDEIEQHDERATFGLALSSFYWSESEDGGGYWLDIYNDHDDLSQHPDVLAYNQPEKAMKDSLKARKLDWTLLTVDMRPALEKVAEVLHHAAYDKDIPYGPGNWMKGYGDPVFGRELLGALDRHETAIQKGELIDPDDDKPHRAHKICSELFLLMFDIMDDES